MGWYRNWSSLYARNVIDAVCRIQGFFVDVFFLEKN